MKRALIKPEKCNNCSECAVMIKCTMEAVIRENIEDKPWIDFYRCSGCMKCKGYCDHSAIEEITQPCNGKGKIGW
ncbi:MAG: hypothetical protein SNJ70_00260 [Armatimonadota bacterium]